MHIIEIIYQAFIFLFFLITWIPIILFYIWMKVDKFLQTRRGFYIEGTGDYEFEVLTYHEGKNSLFIIGTKIREGKMKGRTVFEMPSPELWQRDKPAWAKDRRDEILDRIKKHYKNRKYDYVDSERDIKAYKIIGTERITGD